MYWRNMGWRKAKRFYWRYVVYLSLSQWYVLWSYIIAQALRRYWKKITTMEHIGGGWIYCCAGHSGYYRSESVWMYRNRLEHSRWIFWAVGCDTIQNLPDTFEKIVNSDLSESDKIRLIEKYGVYGQEFLELQGSIIENDKMHGAESGGRTLEPLYIINKETYTFLQKRYPRMQFIPIFRLV